jgi:hypothetical protein
MQLEDGKGTGRKAEINLSNQLSTFSVVETEFLSVNANEEKAFVWDYPAYNYSAGDTVMWLRNDSDLNLHIHHIFLYCDTATTVSVHKPDNVVESGTVITGNNINLTSGITAEASAIQDEVTGVIGTVMQTEYITANGTLSMFKEEGYELILGKNDVIAVDLTTLGTSTFGHIVGYYK